MKWGLIALLCLASFNGAAQVTIGRYQYWFDTNYAANDTIATTQAGQLNFSVSISTSGISYGLHVLNSRFQQSNGKNSTIISRFFIKSAGGVGSSRLITGYEYWFDDNYGGKISVGVACSASNALNTAINASALPAGLHSFHFRVKDNSNQWTATVSQLFIKSSSTSNAGSAAVTGYEYWFDGNYGSKVIQAVSPVANLHLVNPVNSATLSNGVHTLYIRFKDNGNNWSGISTSLFLKTMVSGAGGAKLIAGYEYWYDNDYINKVTATVAATSQLHLVSAINASALSNGVHAFNIRFKDNGNNWSAIKSTVLMKSPAGNSSVDSNVVTAMRYWIDTARSQMQKVAVVAPARQVLLLSTINCSSLDTGKHYIYFQFQDTLHNWSSVRRDSFRFNGLVLPDIVVGTVPANFCAGAALQVPFTLHSSFGSSNLFTAQLSAAGGSFASPVNIGTLSGNASSAISATIPAATLAGAGYRIRIIASQPADTSALDSIPITIKRVPEQAFSITGPLLSCTAVAAYAVSPAQSGVTYTWQLSGGGTLTPAATTASVAWATAGNYALSVTSSNTCGNGVRDTVLPIVLSSPPANAPAVVNSGNYLTASALSGSAAGYQWYRNDTLIGGVTGSTYTPAVTAIYKACFTNVCGAGVFSGGTFYFVKANQTIAFPAITNRTYGDSAFRLNATASSGLPVSYTVSGPAVLSSSDTIIITGAGSVTITALQTGDTAFYAAPAVVRSFNIAKAPQAISFGAIPDKIYGDTASTLTASVSTGLPLSFAVLSGNAYIAGGKVYVTGGGGVVVRAVQQGNQNYLPAFADDTFCVKAAAPDSIKGYTSTCINTLHYYVDSVAGFNYTWSLSGLGTLSPPVGGATDVSWTALGNSVLTVSATTGCSTVAQTKTLSVQIVPPLTPAAPGNLYPADSTVIGSFPYPFSWLPSTNAQLYDIYIWQAGTAIPSVPTVVNISQIGYAIGQYNLPGFNPGQWYSWKVVAKNACSQTPSAVRAFRVASLPDLVVSSVIAPDTVYSNTSITVAVTVKNVGHAITNGYWYDGLFLSTDSVFSSVVATNLSNSFYVAALDTQQSYTKNITVTLPHNIVGNNFLFGYANVGNGGLTESTTANNTRFRNIYIKQSPIPDLRVTSVLTTGSTFSGQNLTATWTVKNHGTGNTQVGAWTDFIYVSQDSVFNTNTAIYIDQLPYTNGLLSHDSSYTRSKVLTLPTQAFGKSYIYVVTDATNAVYESAFENNNTGRSDSLNIYLTPPPDFFVTNFNAPLYASRGEAISIDWTVKNGGAIRRVKDSVWTDAVRVTADSPGNVVISSQSFSPPLVLTASCGQYPLGVGGCRYAAPMMDAGDTYYTSASISLPTNRDSVYVQVKTDAQNNIFEYLGENNNTSRVKVRFLNPDLVITNVQLPAGYSSGSNQLAVQWRVKNSGPGKTPNVSRADQIYLSASPGFNPLAATYLGSFAYTNIIDTGNTITLNTSVTIPANVASGSYYVFVVCDAGNSIQETNESNNISSGVLLQFTALPKPDLYVTQVAINPAAFVSEHKIHYSYTVKNQDSGTIAGTAWSDKIYLSGLPVWNIDSARLLATVSSAVTLPKDSTYSVDDSLLIPSSALLQLHIDSTNCYFYVWTDADTSVYEGAHENNNVTRSAAVFASLPKHPDLAEISFVIPDSLHSGAAAGTSWGVRNNGGSTSFFTGAWHDGLYLSLDTVLSSQDIFVRDALETQSLDSGMQYSSTMNFNVPNGLSGYYYPLMVADAYNQTADNNRGNNYKILHNQNATPHPVYISLTPPPDLVVNALQVPQIGYSGQPSLVKWTVKNQGVGPTAGSSWADAFYLSADTLLDNTDIAVGGLLHSSVLAAGSTYSDSTMVYMPATAQGNYYLLLKTDNYNAVYEHTNENNNVRAAICYIIRPLPSDLIVSQIQVDTACNAGDSASVSWVVQNVGVNPATGYMRQGIYLSADSIWSNDDVLLDNPPTYITLMPSDTVHRSSKFRVNSVTPGRYYAIIRTDLLNNIVEQDETNNTGHSLAKIHVSALNLPVDTLKYNVLRNNYELYYKIDIPASLAGETISVSLKGDSVHGANELYLRYDTLPSRAKYDYAYSHAFYGNQQILIPAAQQGTYYLLAYGATSGASQQSISLLAQKIDFSILSVQSNQGGNKGNVTIRIDGAKFQPGMTARLYSSSLGTITANTLYYINSTLVYATFNLAGKQTGIYDVRLVKPAIDSVSAVNAFTIVTGSGGTTASGVNGGNSNGFYCYIKNIGVEDLLGFEVQHPSSTPPNRTFPMTIIFGNSGDEDIPIPTRMLISATGFPIALTTGTLPDKKTEIFLEFREAGGPTTLLRPGAVGYITIFTTSSGGQTSRMDFNLVE